MTTSQTVNIDLSLSALAPPDVTSICFLETEDEMPPREKTDMGSAIWRTTIRLTVIGLLSMGTVIKTRVSNAESLKIESAVNDYMSPSSIRMQRSVMKGPAEPAIQDKEDGDSMDQILLSFLSESSFARQQITEMIIDRYTSSKIPSESITEDLENAIEAIEFLETDGEPIQVEGHPFLFVGSVGASLNHDALNRNGITNVISWSKSAKCNTFDDIEYMCVSGIRTDQNLRDHLDKLDKAVEWVESTRKSGGRVMSHCWYGKNRSVTLLVAYLMKYEDMSEVQANDLIKKSRPQAAPYFWVLKAYSELYLSSNAENSTKKNKPVAKNRFEDDAR